MRYAHMVNRKAILGRARQVSMHQGVPVPFALGVQADPVLADTWDLRVPLGEDE